jgi:N-acetylmuramoyl-L-alanine amidase
MIAALCCLLHAASLAPDSLHVRVGDRDVAIDMVETGAGPALPADRLVLALGGALRSLTNGHYTVALPGAEFDVTPHVPFARVGDDVLPLTTPPFVEGGRLYVPLQLVAELVPRYAVGLTYDPERGELSAESASGRVSSGRGAAPSAGAGAGTQRTVGAASTVRAAAGKPRVRRRRVVVDAGHGGPDHGMSGPIGVRQKIREKDVTLAVAQRVADALRARGVEVTMTRTTDTLIALADRGRIANEKGADVFLSIHVNAANMRWRDPAAARGFETYFLAEAKTEEESRVENMENEAVRFETQFDAPKGDPLSFIKMDMAQNEHLRESYDLAGTIQQGLGRTHPGPDRGVKQANFAVLRTSFMPAVLVEIGFGTNAAEAAYISSPSRQRELAAAIANGTLEYLSHYERRVAGGGK